MATTELVGSPSQRAGNSSSARSEGARHAQFPCLDGFRAIAAGTVLLTHVSFITGYNGNSFWGPLFARMDAGVSVFFLISGFLLFRPFVAANLADRPGPAVGSYAKRRVLRIYPAYWVALVVVLLIGTHGYGVGDLLAQFGLVHVYGLHTYLGPTVTTVTHTPGHPLDQAWSLGTEISFYLFLPLYDAVIARLGRRSDRTGRFRIHLAGLAALVAIAEIYRLVVLTSGISAATAGMMLVWLPNYLDQFALGMLLALLSVWWADRPARVPAVMGRRFVPAACWLLAGVSFWAVAHWVGLPVSSLAYTTGEQFARHYLYAATAFFLLLPGMFGPSRRGLIRLTLQTRLLVWLGLVSYGVYIWQNVVIDRYLVVTHSTPFAMSFVGTLGWVAVITVAIATVSYFVVEKPALRLKDRRLGSLFVASSVG